MAKVKDTPPELRTIRKIIRVTATENQLIEAAAKPYQNETEYMRALVLGQKPSVASQRISADPALLSRAIGSAGDAGYWLKELVEELRVNQHPQLDTWEKTRASVLKWLDILHGFGSSQ